MFKRKGKKFQFLFNLIHLLKIIPNTFFLLPFFVSFFLFLVCAAAQLEIERMKKTPENYEWHEEYFSRGKRKREKKTNKSISFSCVFYGCHTRRKRKIERIFTRYKKKTPSYDIISSIHIPHERS